VNVSGNDFVTSVHLRFQSSLVISSPVISDTLLTIARPKMLLPGFARLVGDMNLPRQGKISSTFMRVLSAAHAYCPAECMVC